MKIESYTDGSGKTHYTINLDGTENPEFREVLEGWLDALEYHEYKSRGYKRRDIFSLGIKGEFVGFWRKVQKLLPMVWEAKTLTGEGTQEVLMDTFGSVGLMLQALRKTSDKYSASWRDNHSNKPTFGPGPTDPHWSGVQAKPPMSSEDLRWLGGVNNQISVIEALQKCDRGGMHEFIGSPRACGKCGIEMPITFD